MILGEVVIVIMVSMLMAAVVYSAGYYAGAYHVLNEIDNLMDELKNVKDLAVKCIEQSKSK